MLLLERSELGEAAVGGLIAVLTVLARLSTPLPGTTDMPRYARSVAYAKQARDLDGDSALAHAVRAQIHLVAGELGAASAKAARAFRKDENSIDAGIVRALCAEATDSPQAPEQFDAAAALLLAQPDPLAALHHLARPRPTALLHALARRALDNCGAEVALLVLDGGADDLAEGADGPPVWTRDVEAARLRARCLLALDRSDEAADALCDAGDRLLWLNDLVAADEATGEAIGLAPKHVRGWVLRAAVLLWRSFGPEAEDWIRRSRECATRADELAGPAGAGAYHLRTWAAIEERLAQERQHGRAASCWAAVGYAERAWLLDSTGAYPRALLATQLRQAAVDAVAREEAQRAYALDPGNPLARDEYLISATNFGDYLAAEEALPVDAVDPWTSTLRAYLLASTGRPAEAVPIVDAVIESQDELKEWQYATLAICLEKCDHHDRARSLRQFLWDRREQRSDLLLYVRIGLLLGHVEEAKAFLDEAVDEPDKLALRALRGIAELQGGQIGLGHELLKAVIEATLNPEDLFQLGEELDRVSAAAEAGGVEGVVRSLHTDVAVRARTLIVTNLVAAQVAALPEAAPGTTDPQSVGIRLVRARYANQDRLWEQAATAYLGLAEDLKGAPEVVLSFVEALSGVVAAAHEDLRAGVRAGFGLSPALTGALVDNCLPRAVARYELSRDLLQRAAPLLEASTVQVTPDLPDLLLGLAVGLGLLCRLSDSVASLQAAAAESAVPASSVAAVGQGLGWRLALLAQDPRAAAALGGLAAPGRRPLSFRADRGHPGRTLRSHRRAPGVGLSAGAAAGCPEQPTRDRTGPRR